MASSLSGSQTQDSDELQEMYCEECDKHSVKYVPAEGFCVDCVEYRCDLCILYHKKHYRYHQVQDKNKMPQDFCFEKCSDHPYKIAKFYSEKCDKFACYVYKTNNHQNCNKVRHLPTLVKGVEQSNEFKDLLEQMDTLSEDLEYTKQQLQSNLTYIISQETNEKLKISNQKDKLVFSYIKQQKEGIESFEKKMEEPRERQAFVEQLADKKRNLRRN
ncbi:transcription intermediary factor 1-alpha-like [Mercenaria mercenaria]|uniref:transcription intermediary factor 1-alpha-like n=1 Tax=Mercenaria mercenaria TaxID=6596 RepID=UPI00234F7C08|nr:transcription intermediary factor 1-alpha-like [Mercenaria mercenaria]